MSVAKLLCQGERESELKREREHPSGTLPLLWQSIDELERLSPRDSLNPLISIAVLSCAMATRNEDCLISLGSAKRAQKYF